MMDTPVAFFIFNRPQLSKTVFEAIRQFKPSTLLVVADGPRNPAEKLKCDEARAVVKAIDWDCQVKTNYSDINLGCRNRVSTGLDWVFSQVTEAIIIEDDCLPSPDFFRFCQQLLERYRDDPKVMLIDGSHIDDGIKREHSYYFSRYAGIWGWASWRRAWKHYDVSMKTWPAMRKSRKFQGLFNDVYEYMYWKDVFDKIFAGKIDTWDYQWVYACLVNDGWSVKPSVNLVENLGFGVNATHTKSHHYFWDNMKVDQLGELRHPSVIRIDPWADKFTFDHYCGNKMRSSWIWKLRALIAYVS